MSKLKPAAWAHISDGKIGSITYSKGLAGSWEVLGAKVTPLYAIPEGYALVPIEPTEEMLAEGENQREGEWESLTSIYKAMIKAAQETE